MKRIGIILSVFIFMFCISGVSCYADSDISVNTKIGFDGKCKLGGINPIKVTIESKNTEYSGRLNVNVGDRVYTHKVDLEKNTKKSFEFAIPIFNENDIEVDVGNDDVIDATDVSPEIYSQDTIFVGILSDKYEDYYYMNDINILDKDNVQVVKLDNTLNYTTAEIYNIDFIVLDNFSTKDLTEKGENTLKNYIKRGNIVLVGNGKYAYKNLTGVFKNLDNKTNIGDGRVLPVDLENKNIVNGTLQKNITPALMTKINNTSNFESRINQIKKLYNSCDNILKPKYSSLYFLIAILVIYIFLLTLSIFIKKYHKYSFLSVVVGFCVVFYGLALWGGFESTKGALASIKVYKDGLYTYNLANIYPYKKDGIDITTFNSEFLDAVDSEKYEVDLIDKKIEYTDKENYHIYSHGFKDIQSEDITISLSKDDILNGDIKNTLSNKMINSFLIVGDTVINIGDIDGKEVVNINYKIDHNLRNTGDYNYIEKICKDAELNNYQRDMLEYYFYNINDFDNVKLIGFSSENNKLKIDEKDQKIKESSMNVFDVKLKSNNYAPCETIKPVVYYGQNKEKVNEKREYILQNNSITLYYKIPDNLKAYNIDIFTKADTDDLYLEYFNQVTNSWEALNDLNLKEEQIYEGTSKGPLTLRLTGSGRVILPQISVNGLD